MSNDTGIRGPSVVYSRSLSLSLSGGIAVLLVNLLVVMRKTLRLYTRAFAPVGLPRSRPHTSPDQDRLGRLEGGPPHARDGCRSGVGSTKAA